MLPEFFSELPAEVRRRSEYFLTAVLTAGIRNPDNITSSPNAGVFEWFEAPRTLSIFVEDFCTSYQLTLEDYEDEGPVFDVEDLQDHLGMLDD